MLGNGEGPIPARVLIVGEAWGEREEQEGKPFVGSGGTELNRMLHEAGILRTECFVTNLVNARPPGNDITRWIAGKKGEITASHVMMRDKYVLPILVEGFRRLMVEIDAVQPNVIICLGNAPMWALTGMWGIGKWRGSMLSYAPLYEDLFKLKDGKVLFPKILPTYHPKDIYRQWDLRGQAVTDLRRAKREIQSRVYNKPKWNFIVRPSLGQVTDTLHRLFIALQAPSLLPEWDRWIDFDIETKAGHIDCVGLSWSRLDALIIPLMCKESRTGYWGPDEEAHIVFLLYRVLTHPRVKVRWQNGLYDAQYTHRHWHFVPRGCQDTMIDQHTAFCALPKGLGFIASMYCEWFVYWKDEGKIASYEPEEKRWVYNGQDCVYTRECGEVLQATVESLGLADVAKVQQALFWPVLAAMQRGVRILPDNRAEMDRDLTAAIESRRAFISSILGHPINIGSPKQMCELFYEDLKQRPVLKRTTRAGGIIYAPTCDDEALMKIGAREPILKPLVNAIADIRTLEKLLNDFVHMKEDSDGRMRCSFNIAGDAAGKSAPYSYRLSSSKNAFGSGGNLQTIPSEKSKSSGKAAARGSLDFSLPNIRRMYGPDPGYTFFDMDLDRADLQVFAWEIEDEILKAALRQGVDMHLMHVYLLDGVDPPPLEELVEGHPRYKDHRGPRKHKREFSKVFCHAVDYYAQDKTLSEHTGWSVHEVGKARKRYLSIHPNIEPYWAELDKQIKKRRYVENKFGYRWYIFDRVEGELPNAIAWIPQSTVGNVINRAWLNIHNNLPEVQVLIQVHDSLAGQGPTHLTEKWVPALEREARIVIPYPDPLIIPVGVKTSPLSWGDCA